jgi:hypothetical protein
MRNLKKAWHRPGIGQNVVFGIGTVITGVMISSIAIDMGTYFSVQRQLQSAVDSAALAGAVDLPSGMNAATASATQYAQMNQVAGQTLTANNLSFSQVGNSFKVAGTQTFQTSIAQFFCSGSLPVIFQPPGGTNAASGSSPNSNCSTLTVKAEANAQPAARDTVLVVDVSWSMGAANGYNKKTASGGSIPIENMRQAINAYLDKVNQIGGGQMERVALVSFNLDADLRAPLTSLSQSANFATIRNLAGTMDKMVYPGASPYAVKPGSSTSGGGQWNTNYSAALKVALDQLQNNGRPNAIKQIIFMSDGLPNLAGDDRNNLWPASMISLKKSGNTYAPYSACLDTVIKNTTLKNTCTSLKITCPTTINNGSSFNNPLTFATTYSYGGGSCGQSYLDYVANTTLAQATRAKNMKVTINTFRLLTTPDNQDTANVALSAVSNKANYAPWAPELLSSIASTTGGIYPTAVDGNNAQAAINLYQKFASTYRVVLTKQ